MCGIYGMVSLSGAPLACPGGMEPMAAALAHRGPDGRGRLNRRDAAFGAERLRIVDLDPRADQPFADPANDVWLACNGEIYNAAELRRRFGGYRFRSRSDVETILPLYLAAGVAGVADLDGMFALAVWDAPRRCLLLARDPAGEKPLFYARRGREIWFASEPAALLASPAGSRDIDDAALSDFLLLGYVRAPRTMFPAIRQVEPGTAVVFHATGMNVSRHWDPAAVAPQDQPVSVAIGTFRRLFSDAVAKQLAADVPVGVFTSGGLDSSLLAARAVRTIGPARVRTFAARFAEPSYDESAAARRLSRALGTPHLDVPIDEPALRRALRRVVAGVAEPLADPAILPTYLLAEAAREHVAAVLSGEGADELFGGYPTYLGHHLAPGYARLTPLLRRTIARLVRAWPASPDKITIEFLLKRFVAAADRPWLERHLAWFGTGLAAPPLDESRPRPADAAAAAMLFDYGTYLPDNLLTKVDRATMLASLEARAPFLDRELSSFALRLPPSYKVRGLTTKWLLRRAAAGWVPPFVLARRKRGLSVPVAAWLNRGLRAETDRLLDAGRLRRQGLVEHLSVGTLVAEHRTGRANRARELWALIVLQLWLERWCEEAR